MPTQEIKKERTVVFRDIVRAALDRGLSIHPVKPRGKEPCLKGWPQKATRDESTIAAWSIKYPDSNYGVVADDTFCILESDNLPALMEKLSRGLPFTYRVQARVNRPHIYFRQTPKSHATGNMDCAGIYEFKQNRKYVVGEGSTHPTGSVYRCVQDEPIADIPDWLIEDLVRIKSAGAGNGSGLNGSGLNGSGLKVSASLPADGRKLGEGEGRHPALVRAAAQMWDGKMTREEFREKLQAINLEHCDPPKSEVQLLSIIDWMMEREPVNRGPEIIVTPGPGVSKAPSPDWGLESFSEIESRPIRWLWKDYLALGKLSTVNGEPSSGKSFIMLDTAARLNPASHIDITVGSTGP